ncbi:L-arabinose isomerase [Salibacterium halotolerans]|uniref:L-arabinose isomerase n=1 Tax=Salibacterium halotolerans TaxID=1884432 RepID=A0A1I5XUU0_9BACI|nr:L-arabinose isomerase [Salibacterium halotolerans]SFQ35636.1 L-arabinose isomerase [Salibacterium halotolerans]
MMKSETYEIWFITGSQHLYGPETLDAVKAHSKDMVEGLQAGDAITTPIRFKQVVTTSDEILTLIRKANSDESCAGIITWMHTFSPAKIWIAGLKALQKPLLHLHTQYNAEIPWNDIDMDFMNLNQSAHGDREFGFMTARLDIPRKVVAGHWQQPHVQKRIGRWAKSAVSASEGRKIKVARFGDNMRNVAVTEGDKVEAEAVFGWIVQAHGIGDLVDYVDRVTEEQVDDVVKEYRGRYHIPEDIQNNKEKWDAVREQARIEAGMEAFLEEGGYTAFTTNFEDLHGMKQLPGLAVQRLMEKGYGFGGEGDWKTAALVRAMKVMAEGRETSFMEDYTYHLEEGRERILGSHMLEVCPTIHKPGSRPEIQVHPLSMGDREDPSRLVFDSQAGRAVNACIIDLGDRFRLVLNEVEAEDIKEDMPNLPVARVLWDPKPNLQDAAESWILAGGAHHTCLTYALTSEDLQDWAEINGIECIVIDETSKPREIQKEIRQNEYYWSKRK